MALFAVSAQNDELIAPVIAEVYPNDHVKAWPGLWFVADEATAQQVSEKLGIPVGARGYAFVSSVGNYWGWGPKNAWEWLALKAKSGSST